MHSETVQISLYDPNIISLVIYFAHADECFEDVLVVYEASRLNGNE